ncbi:MAG: hypothetical protein HQM08_15345 [Candidatus Riflebacteria bacterium]|nr:hypothetical protein [Candidatus Riflebacteria bacterium]
MAKTPTPPQGKKTLPPKGSPEKGKTEEPEKSEKPEKPGQKGAAEKKGPPDKKGAPVKNGDSKKGPDLEEETGSTAAEETEKAKPSKIEAVKKLYSRYLNAIMNLAFIFLVGVLGSLLVVLILMLDFLDVISIRYKIPENYRKSFPLNYYYDFIKINELPGEERLQALIKREQTKFSDLITSGSDDLQKRASELENSYKELVRAQEEKYKRRQTELLALQEENLAEKKKLEELKVDLENRKDSVDILSKQLASEALKIESSLSKLMEGENRLKPVQQMVGAMDPKEMAKIFDEVSDNQLIYNILKGVPPERASLILATMDAEKAGKIVAISESPPKLPPPDAPKSYIPKSLTDLIASAQANIK